MARKKPPSRSELPPEKQERLRAKAREYAAKNRQRIAEWMRQYRRDHPDMVKAVSQRQRAKERQENPARLLWRETRKRARQRGIPFDLEVSDISYPEVCPILGIPLEHNTGVKKSRDNSPSLDRLVPAKGYVKGNCYIISNKANRMKQDNTLEDFERILAYIKERLTP